MNLKKQQRRKHPEKCLGNKSFFQQLLLSSSSLFNIRGEWWLLSHSISVYSRNGWGRAICVQSELFISDPFTLWDSCAERHLDLSWAHRMRCISEWFLFVSALVLLFYCLFFLREEGGRAFNISEEELVWSRSISGNSWSGMPLKNKERPVMFWDWGGRYRPRIFHFLGFFSF